MSKRPKSVSKRLTQGNLEALGADRLAALLLELGDSQPSLKRRLRMELAAEVGPEDLAEEIDKRINALATSRAKVSWRKRGEMIVDLHVVRRIIGGRLGELDAASGMTRLVAFLDLAEDLGLRVKDPKGELSALFFDAAPDLATVASAVGTDAVPILAEAVETRLSDWGGWIGRAAPTMNEPLASGLLKALTVGRARPTGRRALVVRKLADRAGDVEAWAAAFSDEDRLKPDVGAEIARRLAQAGRAVEARTALEASRPVAPEPVRWGRAREAAPPPPPDVWLTAEIAVLDAEGRAAEAVAARWMLFERTLAEAPLREVIAGLPDFEDVVALDRAHAHAAAFPDATKGLAFLMGWPAHREAATMVMSRSGEIRGSTDDVPLWAARLEGRYPVAALLLVRARARALARLAGGLTDEVQSLIAEAAVLGATSDVDDDIPDHAAFVTELEAIVAPQRRGWR